MDCLFCKIARGDLPSFKIHENDRALAFLDINPGARGHVLVIPRRHAENFLDLEAEDRDAVMALAHEVSVQLMAEDGVEGLNLHQSNGAVAGQVVFHFHLHLLPRRRGDDLRSPWIPKEADMAELESMAARLARACAGA